MSQVVDRERLDHAIRGLANQIGLPCRGRIEIVDGNRVNVIEFEGNGKWKRTGFHDKDADDAFSMFREFRLFKLIEAKLCALVVDLWEMERKERG